MGIQTLLSVLASVHISLFSPKGYYERIRQLSLWNLDSLGSLHLPEESSDIVLKCGFDIWGKEIP